MSSASVTSTKRKVDSPQDLEQELEAIRAMNSSLRVYLEHLRGFKKNLNSMNSSCKQLSKVNSKWIDTVSRMK